MVYKKLEFQDPGHRLKEINITKKHPWIFVSVCQATFDEKNMTDTSDYVERLSEFLQWEISGEKSKVFKQTK